MTTHHELCDLVPQMTDEEYANLRDDIRENGQLDDIVLYEGAILDGRHRHRACTELGIEPRFRQYEGGDPAGYVFSVNIARRQLGKGQLAMAGAALKAYYAVKAKERMAAGGGDHRPGKANLPDPVDNAGQARDEAARKVGVSGRSVDVAEEIIKKGVPRLTKAVQAGAISLNAGASIARLPKAAQEKIVDLPTKVARGAAIRKSTNYKHAGQVRMARKPAAPPNDNLPGTELVRALLSRLETIANQIAVTGLNPHDFAKQFRADFDWDEPLLVMRLGYAADAIVAISDLTAMCERARSQANRKPLKVLASA